MYVIDAMLAAAVSKAVKLGLLPKAAEFIDDWETVRQVLEAALAAAAEERSTTAGRPADPFAGCRYVVFTEILDGIDALTGLPVYRDTPMIGTNHRAAADKHAARLSWLPGSSAWVVDRGEAKPDEERT